MFYDVFESPLGAITIAGDNNFLRELHIEGDRYFTAVPESWIHKPDAAVLRQTRKELASYFDGKLSEFSVPHAFDGTDFQKQVWQALLRLPAGQTTTYAAIATLIGKPKAVRAVGTAVGRNPICIVVPCHRVLASSGGLGGYVAGLDRKSHLLKLEQGLGSGLL